MTTTRRSCCYDIIAIGESLRDVFYALKEDGTGSILDRERNLLCFEYAEKIPVKNVVKVPAAGNACNTAVGASRLGLKTAVVSWVGSDPAGDDVRRALKTDKVDHRYVVIDKKYPTSEATILNYLGERTQLVYFQPRSYKLPALASTRCIYYSAMGEKHDAFDRLLHEMISGQAETFFVFQPGTTHINHGLAEIKALISRSDLFILNKDEAHRLLSDGERSLLSLMSSFRNLGAKKVIITDGKNGAEAYDGHDHWRMPVFPAKVVETTGAGDSFAIGVTAALLKGLSLDEALRWGAANSASVIGEIGPQKGLLDQSGINKMLRQHSKIKAQLIKH